MDANFFVSYEEASRDGEVTFVVVKENDSRIHKLPKSFAEENAKKFFTNDKLSDYEMPSQISQPLRLCASDSESSCTVYFTNESIRSTFKTPVENHAKTSRAPRNITVSNKNKIIVKTVDDK